MAVRRVLQVIPSVGPLRGGPSAMVRLLAAGLARLGIESDVATTNDNGPGTLDVPLGAPLDDRGVRYWHFPRQARAYTFSWPLASWLRRHVADYDIVHIHALFSWAALPASHWAFHRGVPYVVRPLGTLNTWGMRERRPWLKTASFRFIERRIVQHAAVMHYTSEQERIEAESLSITTRAVVMPNPLPPRVDVPRGAFRRAHPELADRPIVLFLSRIDRKKGVDLLLRAFAGVRGRVPDAALVMAGVGDGHYAGELRKLARALDLGNAVVWTGFLDGERKAAALSDADVFVLPSHSENFGIAVAEAMAAGLSVVVSDQVAIADDVARAGAGLVVPRDAAALADAIVRLLGDADLRASAGRNGRQFATTRYSQDAVAQQLLDVYTGLVQ